MASRARLLVWGAAGHARVVAEVVRAAGEFEIAGFLDDVNPERAGEAFCGSRILGGAERLGELRDAGVASHALVAFGQCEPRLRAGEQLRAAGFACPTAVHPSAVMSPSAVIGAGTVVMPNAVVNAGSTIGAHVIVNTAASVDHDCTVGDGVHCCPGVRVAGSVCIGRAVWLGIGSVVIDGVSIGASTVIGAGALVLQNVPAGVLAYGVPARVVRKLS